MTQEEPRRDWRRPDASMSLLADLFDGKALDPAYAEAAARRTGEPRRPGRLRRGGVLFVLVLTGVLAAVAAAEVKRSEPATAQQRARLIGEIKLRTDENEQLERRVDRLGAETERLRGAALARSDAGRRAKHDLTAAQTAAAAAPASGPGLTIVLDDSRSAGDDGRVYDQDLQIVVNGLWAAGATAIGINGQRLTPTSAIRTAGEAVLVDYRPLTGPYRVTALGDTDLMTREFAGSAADQRLRALQERFRIRVETRTDGSARLPAAGPARLRHARPGRELSRP
ncbi:DUF881 domain-containing protein [Spirillospora sp. CA-294931]|uniref:DUF881 domain-containing protein n=1 Tax=Spirillospora sp. CA-294931 TaxID=3240042 RepID=UPI003D943E68